jgi:hypothetical protein
LKYLGIWVDVIEARFDGGSMSSDGGVMLLAALDKRFA